MIALQCSTAGKPLFWRLRIAGFLAEVDLGHLRFWKRKDMSRGYNDKSFQARSELRHVISLVVCFEQETRGLSVKISDPIADFMLLLLLLSLLFLYLTSAVHDAVCYISTCK